MGCCKGESKVGDATFKEGRKKSFKHKHNKKLCFKKILKKKSRRTLMSVLSTADSMMSEDPQSTFPCCFDIPLDIAMEGLAFLDIIYYTFFAIVSICLVTLEPFAGRHPLAQKAKPIGLDNLEDFYQILYTDEVTDPNDVLDYDDRYSESTTTVGVASDEYFGEDDDANKYARTYSRIAFLFQQYGQEVDDGCGRTYYRDYLFSQQLDITRELFESLARNVIGACVMYIAIAIIFLICICCFRGHRLSKLLVIVLCYAELGPSYLILRLLAISQSQRLCILQHGMGPTFKGQTILFWVLLWPLISFKPYKIFIWTVYVKRYFHNKDGVLLDESFFSASKVEERQKKLTDYYRTLNIEEFQHHPRFHGSSLFKYQHRRRARAKEDGGGKLVGDEQEDDHKDSSSD